MTIREIVSGWLKENGYDGLYSESSGKPQGHRLGRNIEKVEGSVMKERKYKRWVLIGKYSLSQLVDIARSYGMVCICAFKVPMCVHNQIGLFGTPDQMSKTQGEWIKAEHKVTNRQPSYAFSMDIDKPRESWVDSVPEKISENSPAVLSHCRSGSARRGRC